MLVKNAPSEEDYNPKLIEEQSCQKHGYYFKTQGYRKVAGNSCYGGLNRNPEKVSCSFIYLSSHRSIFIVVGVIVGLGICYYCGASSDFFASLKERFSKYF